ncbi:MAG: HlyD family efflux transporter periplasmic adaptor subunit [Pirellulales bacterium]
MATDIQAETHEAYEIHESHAARDAHEERAFVLGEPGSPSRWWKRGVLIVAAVAVVATVAALIAGASSRSESGPQLTHTIARRDVIVSVTEQGTLESSDNTEIKCKVRGTNTVLWVIDAGTEVKPGDELVKLDTSTIEDNINQQKIAYQRALATHTQSQADTAVAKIAITEYVEGTYRAALKTLEKDLAIGEANLRAAKTILDHSRRMFKRGYVSELEVERNEFTLKQSNLELELKKTEIDVLMRFTKAKQMEVLESALKAAEAKLASDKASLDLEKARLDREEQQLENCVILASAGGMVIYPSAAQWKETPDIEEGANVREDQLLLMIPDLTKMQVKVGIHESKVDRIKKGMPAIVRLRDETIDGKVASVASVTRPAGWWTGNVVKYDTIVELDTHKDLSRA